MKKLLLSIAALSILFSVSAQQRIPVSKDKLKIERTTFVNPSSDEIINIGVNNQMMVPVSDIEEVTIGNSYYDLQSNSVYGERDYMTPSGEMAVVWTQGLQDAPNFPDRGAGYNYYDGVGWQEIPTEPIESIRAGWPSIAMHMDGEIVASHDFGSYRVIYNKRDVRGTGEWNEFFQDGPAGATGIVWPRIATSGANHEIIHVIANTFDTYEGYNAAMVYSRSIDGGDSWEVDNVILPELEGYAGFAADDYKLITKGNTVVMLFCSQWYDLFYLKSDDNGQNWTKNVVWENPYSGMTVNDIVTGDTLWCPGSALDADIDGEGKVHLVFDLTQVKKDEVGDEYVFYPWTDGIIYWNEDMDPFENVDNQHEALSYDNLEEGVNLVGWVQDIDGDGQITFTDAELPQSYRQMGLSTMPTIFIHGDVVEIIYSATTETLTYDSNGEELNFKHLFGTTISAGVMGEIYHLTSNLLHNWDEIIYPSIIGLHNNQMYYSCQIDNTGGLALDDDHPYGMNRIVVGAKPVIDAVNGNIGTASLEVSQNYPNPANESTTVKVKSDNHQEIKLNVVNILGQSVYAVNIDHTPGVYSTVNIPTSNMASGIYFYTVICGTEKVTKKMNVR